VERCFGSIAQQSRDSVVLFWRSSVGIIPARTKRLSIGVERRHPVTYRRAWCVGLSTRQVCLLQHQTRTQYSEAEWIKARVAVSTVWHQSPIGKQDFLAPQFWFYFFSTALFGRATFITATFVSTVAFGTSHLKNIQNWNVSNTSKKISFFRFKVSNAVILK